jgi:DNA-directed RNA polymerase subunit RPC12/RpoP
MNIQAIIDAIKSDGAGVTIEYFKISLPAAAADGQPSLVTKEYKCEDCGKPFEPFTWKNNNYTAENAYSWSIQRNGRAICLNCAKKIAKKSG